LIDCAKDWVADLYNIAGDRRHRDSTQERGDRREIQILV